MIFLGAEAVSQASFGEGSGLILLDNVQCTGSEKALMDCVSNSSGMNSCTHAQDAGVRCMEGNEIECIQQICEILQKSSIKTMHAYTFTSQKNSLLCRILACIVKGSYTFCT